MQRCKLHVQGGQKMALLLYAS